MKQRLFLDFSLVVVVALGLANVQLSASDPNCHTRCGCGDSPGECFEREPPCENNEACIWIRCPKHSLVGEPCYEPSSTVNSECSAVPFCELTPCGAPE